MTRALNRALNLAAAASGGSQEKFHPGRRGIEIDREPAFQTRRKA
jgi:hypothetical protein